MSGLLDNLIARVEAGEGIREDDVDAITDLYLDEWNKSADKHDALMRSIGRYRGPRAASSGDWLPPVMKASAIAILRAIKEQHT